MQYIEVVKHNPGKANNDKAECYPKGGGLFELPDGAFRFVSRHGCVQVLSGLRAFLRDGALSGRK